MSNQKDAVKELDKDYWNIFDSINYFDKSLLIKTLLDSPEHTILITAPPGFFKQTNSLMLKCFFRINYTSSGTTDNLVRLWKYQVFKSMKIGKHLELLNRHLSRYPVLHLNLSKMKDEIEATSFQSHFQCVLQSTLAEFAFVEQSCNLDSNEQKEFHKLAYCKLNDSQLEMAIKRICKLFRKHFNEKVIVLIDYYDDLIIRCMNSDYFIGPLVEFLQSMYVGLRGDPNINFVLLTGETNLFKIDGIAEYCFPEYHKFTPHYGVILEDIKSPETLQRLMNADDDTARDSTSFYCTGTGKKKRIYFPWIVSGNDCGFHFSRLLNMIRDSIVLQNSTVRSILQQLLKLEKVAIKVRKQFDCDDIYKLYELCSKCPKDTEDPYLDDESIEVFFAFLVRLGIITETNELNERIRRQFGFQACTLFCISNEVANVVLLTLMY